MDAADRPGIVRRASASSLTRARAVVVAFPSASCALSSSLRRRFSRFSSVASTARLDDDRSDVASARRAASASRMAPKLTTTWSGTKCRVARKSFLSSLARAGRARRARRARDIFLRALKSRASFSRARALGKAWIGDSRRFASPKSRRRASVDVDRTVFAAPRRARGHEDVPR